MSNSNSYNGWTNYATWNVPLWIDNEEGAYKEKLRILRNGFNSRPLTQIDAEFIAESCLGGKSTPDLIDKDGFRWEDVNWNEIAEHWQSELDDWNEELNEETFKEFFEGCEEWIMEYVQSDDYAGEYAYLMGESDRINQSVRKILRNFDYCGVIEKVAVLIDDGTMDTVVEVLGKVHRFDCEYASQFRDESGGFTEDGWANFIAENDENLINWEAIDELADYIATRIVNDGLATFHVCDEYSSESANYLDSFPIGEYEDQIELSRIEEAIGDDIAGDFLEALETYLGSQRDFCIKCWEGMRESKYPNFYLITNTGLRIDFVIEDDVIEELLTELLVATE